MRRSAWTIPYALYTGRGSEDWDLARMIVATRAVVERNAVALFHLRLCPPMPVAFATRDGGIALIRRRLVYHPRHRRRVESLVAGFHQAQRRLILLWAERNRRVRRGIASTELLDL